MPNPDHYYCPTCKRNSCDLREIRDGIERYKCNACEAWIEHAVSEE